MKTKSTKILLTIGVCLLAIFTAVGAQAHYKYTGERTIYPDYYQPEYLYSVDYYDPNANYKYPVKYFHGYAYNPWVGYYPYKVYFKKHHHHHR